MKPKMKKRTNTVNPLRGGKSPENPLLPKELQGRVYKISAFQVQPEISLITESGQEERRFLAQIKLNVFQSGFSKTITALVAEAGLKMSSED
jgi:hypothetical protein